MQREATVQATALLFRALRTSAISSVLLVALMLARDWPFPRWAQWSWGGLMMLVTTLRLLVARRFERLDEPTRLANADRWHRAAILGSLAAGCSWAVGFGAGLFVAEFPMRMFLIALVTGLMAGAVASNAPSRGAFLAFSLPILTVLAFTLLRTGRTDDDLLVGLAVILFTFTVVRTATVVSANIKENLQLVSWQRAAMVEMEETRDAANAAANSRSEFLAVMSHEIRTPLNGVVGMTALLEKTRLDPEQRESLEVIKTSADALMGVLNDVLDLSKIDAGRIQIDVAPVRLRDEVSRLMRLFEARATEKGLGFGLTLAADVPEHAELDWSRVRQVLINLVGNALKFTETGRIDCRVAVAGTQLRFEVEDTGVGLSEAAQGRLFAPFTQADRTVHGRFGGTGLGLSISRKLARLMGGDVTVRSVEGRGSTFTFVHEFTPSAPVVAKLELKREARSLHVLVADDNAVNLRITTRLLERDGHRVVAVVNGEEAVAAAGRQSFDVALLDVQMPVLDGLEAARRIRAERLPMRLVALTANASVADRQACQDAGFDHFLTKPLAPERLAEALVQPPTS